MPTQILMPALSPTMEEGKLAKWLVKEGDKVKSGKVIAEIETDKATMEVEAVDEGTIGKILVAAGTEKVKVNAPIAMLLAEGESAGAHAARRPQPHRRQRPPPAAAPPAASAAAARIRHSPRATGSRRHARRRHQRHGRPHRSPRRSPAASPARPASISPQLTGSGPHGRIVKRDIEAAAEVRRATRAAPAAAGARAPAADAGAATALGHRSRCRRQDPRALREGQPTRSCRTTACAASSPSA